MSGSFQEEIPKARINLKLNLHTGGAQKKVELPLKLLVTGDFSHGQEHRPLSERKKIDINKNNFDSVLSEFSPALNLAVENTLAGDGREENVRLTFRQMKDFEPEQVARQIPQLKAMLAMRNLLRDLKTALKEIDLCLQQIAQLSASADAANALQADIASQSAMFSERLKPLNELIHMQAPDGMAFTSGEHTQLTATKNVAVSAGGDISVGVMGNMTALAGEKLGLFAHSGPLSLKSGEGPLEVQAQNGGMQLAAEKKVTLTSVSDISFAGKKRITLIGGGSYLKLEAGKIEYGTPQVYLRKVEKTYLGASKSRQVEFPYLPGKEGVYSRGFILLDDRTNEPAAGIAYRLTLSSGEKVENVSNNKGCTYIMSHKEKHEVELTILRQESLIIG
ncbi:type VI secretion system contractile sheath small subunit [Cronobacter sakazakii]|nr:type VI secretion system contractile sheath small subunit [Cronobacter sakazakii]ELY6371804.1 type VI secretion system contractile sheath small subunit [Cronobacter sakazakii]PPY03773.1 type VI secretion system contractile sheath small subunit [Cronobacter sakazakii]